MQTCKTCRREFPASFFRIKRGKSVGFTRKAHKCMGCDAAERSRKKAAPLGRFMEKARTTRLRHAAIYSKKWGRKVTASELERDYGWDLHVMAHEIEHASKNGCPYCHEPFSGMGGLHQVTVDIVDREKPPHWSVNKQLCCSTCNSEKGTKTPEQWAEYLQCWKHWHNDPIPPLPPPKSQVVARDMFDRGFDTTKLPWKKPGRKRA
jgi:hypothetical protein